MLEFDVPRWLRSPHLQTLGAAVPLFAPPRSHAGLPAQEMRIPIGDRHALHARAWWAEAREPRLAVVVVHGIGGSSESRYCLRAAVALHRAGHHVVRLDLRGAGASVPDVPSLYHAGLSGDVDAVIEHLSADPRVSGVAIVGFSGGGSVALKRAGEWGSEAPRAVRGIVSISAPLDYTVVAPRMETPACLPYRFHVLRGLVNGARAFARHHPERAAYRPSDVKRMSTFRAYDETVILPMHGFSSVDRYWAESSSGPWLGRIRVPSLLVHAEDDPMVPAHSIRPWLPRVSDAVEVATSPHGGHIGWVSGLDEASWVEGWAMRRALTFLGRIAREPS
jgi:uncharacterized protein